MLNCKRFKDPIYGYIDIEQKIISEIVDTAGFQRLRNIIQTSYAPLYSSAVHNRFVHSLGVYHLGCIVTQTVDEDRDSFSEIEAFQRYLYIFRLACLLHDLGHAPFSHTGEGYYLEKGDRTLLHNSIIELSNDSDLQEEIKNRNYNAAPHELMSVIVSLKQFDNLFQSEAEKSFFARCITGYQYVKKTDALHAFLNCMISLLNSSVIDVDKLDYLIRDAYITGFETVSIDYERLLRSIRIRKLDDKYEIVYLKGAISVIENVVYAHDAERKWIQNHPVVQYEAYLLQSAIEAIKEKYGDTNIFSYDALTSTGVKVSDEYKVSLLCDADIIFLMKNLDNESIDEYYERKNRRHPLWKSESEYKAIFNVGFTDNLFEIVEKSLEEFCKYLNFVNKSQEINEKALQACKDDLQKYLKLAESDTKNKSKHDAAIEKKKKCLQWLNVLKSFADSQKIPFDFVIIRANQFTSGFAKEAFAKIKIEFDMLKKPCYFEKVTNVLRAEKSVRDKFYYLYYRRSEDNHSIDLKEFAILLGQTAMKEVFE